MLSKENMRLLANTATNISTALTRGITVPIMPNDTAWWLVQTLTDVLVELDNKEKELQQMNETFAQFKLIMQGEDDNVE